MLSRGGVSIPEPTQTDANIEVFSTESLCAVTPNPAIKVPLIGTVAVSVSVHVLPSTEE